MLMDIALFLPWFTLILAAIAIGGHAKNYFSKDAKELRLSVERLDKRFADHNLRLQKVETELAHLPTKDQLNELTIALTGINGKVETLNESLGGVSRTVHRIDDYLRREGKG